MRKLIYTALLPLLINSVIARGETPPIDKVGDSLHRLSVQIADSPTGSDDVSTPKSSTETDSPRSQASSDLARLIEWHTKPTVDEDDPAIDCDESPLFMSCARVLTPYMKNHRSSYTKDEKTNLNLILTQIAEDFKSILPIERYEISQQLNILAMFKGELTFIKIKRKGKRKTYEKIKCTLAERFKLGKSRRNPMQMMCAQIEGKMATAELAALTLYESWKTEGILEQKVRSCKWRLKSKGFNKYQWPDNEVIELLTIRTATPHVVKESTYSENEITEFCKRARKKGKRKSQYIKNTAAPQLTQQWRNEGVINEAIAECATIAAEAKLWLAKLSV